MTVSINVYFPLIMMILMMTIFVFIYEKNVWDHSNTGLSNFTGLV